MRTITWTSVIGEVDYKMAKSYRSGRITDNYRVVKLYKVVYAQDDCKLWTRIQMDKSVGRILVELREYRG